MARLQTKREPLQSPSPVTVEDVLLDNAATPPDERPTSHRAPSKDDWFWKLCTGSGSWTRCPNTHDHRTRAEAENCRDAICATMGVDGSNAIVQTFADEMEAYAAFERRMGSNEGDY